MTMATFLKHTQGMLLLLKHILVGLMDPVNPLPSSLCSCPCNVSAPLSLQLFALSLSFSPFLLTVFVCFSSCSLASTLQSLILVALAGSRECCAGFNPALQGQSR